MSMKLMVKAMETRVGNPLRKLVLIKLADNANDAGECWPSYQHIADQCEISRRSVINHINGLEKAGLLVKQSRKGYHKANSSNVYILDLSSESPAPPSESPAPPSESPAPGGGESPAPRTSHSSEPVNEPVNEPIDSAREQKRASKRVQNDKRFDEFWQAYPQKKGKTRARQIWQRKKLDRIADDLIEDVQTRRTMDVQWQDKRYIPHGSTYLHQERWQDEITTTSQVGEKAGQKRDGFAEWFERNDVSDDRGLIEPVNPGLAMLKGDREK